VEGYSHTVSLYGKTPLQNSGANGLNLIYAYNYRKLTDEFNGVNFGDRHSHSFSVGVNGRNRTAVNALQYNVTLHTGTLGTDSDTAETLAKAGGTKGRFTKGTMDATAVQKLGGPFDVLLKLSGQKAASNLDSSEHIYLGGARGVRAYPQGEASGDEGLLGTLELRYHTKVPGLTLSTYFDAGSVKIQKSVAGSTTLKGWGIGLTYSKPNDWFARFDYARRIGFADGLSQDANSKQRMWFIAGKMF
jgi:hemolysin activation/secretion protein